MNDRDKPAPSSPAGSVAPGTAQPRRDRPAEIENPDSAITDPDGPRARREGGPRQTFNEPVSFFLGSERVDGWTLNLSRGGLRAVVEADVAVGAELAVQIGESVARRVAKVVWARRERGGSVLGLAFLDRPDGTISDIPLPPKDGED